MKYTILSLVISGLLCTGCVANKQEDTPVEEEKASTVFYLIRHAEKDRSNPENRNPELTAEGLDRAAYWKEVFREVPLSAVYSTNYKRTMQTALPVARAKGLDILTYDPDTTNLNHWSKAHEGKHILIVGHSNTTPALANQLMGEGVYSDIDDTNNGNIYIISTGSKNNSSVLYLEPSHKGHTETP